jgi:perosamine synthetase
MIPIYNPWPCKYDRAKEAIESGWISSQGKYINEAEKKLTEYFNWNNFILMNNGTTATHVLFLALRQFHPDVQTIYVPNSVYVAVWNCALMEYPKSALRVMPLADNLCIPTDETYLKSLEPNSAIVIVHNVGNIIDIDAIYAVRPDIVLIEDMCEGLFGKYSNGKYVGAHNAVLCSSVSFFANKNITSGEGGGLVTQRSDVAAFIRRIINQGNTSQRYIHDIHAYNYRPTNIQAALLLDQFDYVEVIIERKKHIFERYMNNLKNLESVTFPRTANVANWMFCLRMKGNKRYEDVQSFCKEQNTDIRPFFYPITTHRHLSDIAAPNSDFAEQLQKECIILPSFPSLTDEDIDYISNVIIQYATNINKHT